MVIDEIHTYRGILGSHMAQVLRRLSRICAHYGASPQFLMFSATIALPEEFIRQITGLDVEIIIESGAPQSGRHYLFLNPPAGAATTAAQIFGQAIRKNLATICFTHSRKLTELIHIWSMRQVPELRRYISSYRAGFLPEERREIEARLASGKMRGVISTSALEMGIDIGGLDVCLITSFSALLEGFYDGTTMVSDSVTIQLRNTTAPYSLVDQTKTILDGNGLGSARFTNASNGTPYYIVLKHRNAVETWSALPQTFTANSLTYDFTTGQNKAYGNNLKLVGPKWCIYGGDVNQDGFVETTDLNLVFNSNVNGVSGYVNTDLNGDMLTEIEDLNLVFINSVMGIMKKAPAGYDSSGIETSYSETGR